MNNIRTAIATAMVLVSGAAIASAQQTQAQGQHGARGQRAHGAPGRQGLGPRKPGGQLLRGITLSDAEKANLKNVRAKYASQLKTLHEQLKTQAGTARGTIQRGDTAARRAMLEKTAPQREQIKALLEAERKDIRAALAPENQVKFDANVKQFEQRVANRGQRGMKNGKRPPVGRGPRA
jgi:Spy/CpxP family protein refolding chaperone